MAPGLAGRKPGHPHGGCADRLDAGAAATRPQAGLASAGGAMASKGVKAGHAEPRCWTKTPPQAWADLGASFEANADNDTSCTTCCAR